MYGGVGLVQNLLCRVRLEVRIMQAVEISQHKSKYTRTYGLSVDSPAKVELHAERKV